jgi:MFS family permease
VTPHNLQTRTTRQAPTFYGWWVVAASVVTFGIAVGVPYYNLPFFYDYFQSSFKWSVEEITLGFPLAALVTIWAGPLLIPRLSPRRLIVVGTGASALAFFGFAGMHGSLAAYFGLYLLYTIGYICAGPIPHQLLVSYWFQKKRGRAMGLVYVGVGLFAGLGSFYVRYLTEHFGFRAGLTGMGVLMLVTWPIALLVLRDRPSDMQLYPDGADRAPDDVHLSPLSWGELARRRAFWLLLVGSVCSIGAIGCVNIHMKFVFREAGFTDQKLLNATWTAASVLISWTSIAGRLGIGYLADIRSKKSVMTGTYFAMAGAILLLLFVTASHRSSTYVFAVLFGFAMGADYMLIPLMAAEQFGINTLSRAMAIILPLNTIGQTWFPQFVSFLRRSSGSYRMPLLIVFACALFGAITIALLPRRGEAQRPRL